MLSLARWCFFRWILPSGLECASRSGVGAGVNLLVSFLLCSFVGLMLVVGPGFEEARAAEFPGYAAQGGVVRNGTELLVYLRIEPGVAVPIRASRIAWLARPALVVGADGEDDFSGGVFECRLRKTEFVVLRAEGGERADGRCADDEDVAIVGVAAGDERAVL